MKKAKTFNAGDKVFAKVKGYPAWPAQVVAKNGKRYDVKFFGTGETGCLKGEDLFYYLKHKKQFIKNLKRKDYNDAVEQIEKEISTSGTDGNLDPNSTADTTLELDDSQTETKKSGSKRKRSLSVDGPNKKGSSKKSQDSEENESLASHDSAEPNPDESYDEDKEEAASNGNESQGKSSVEDENEATKAKPVANTSVRKRSARISRKQSKVEEFEEETGKTEIKKPTNEIEVEDRKEKGKNEKETNNSDKKSKEVNDLKDKQVIESDDIEDSPKDKADILNDGEVIFKEDTRIDNESTIEADESVSNDEGDKSISEKKESISEDKESISEDKESNSEDKETISEEKETISEEKETISEDSISTKNKSMSDKKKPIVNTNAPISKKNTNIFVYNREIFSKQNTVPIMKTDKEPITKNEDMDIPINDELDSITIDDDKEEIMKDNSTDDNIVSKKSEIQDIETGGTEAEKRLLADIILIPDVFLTTIIAYADKLREKEIIFKFIDPDGVSLVEDFEQKCLVLPVKLKSGKIIGIKYIPTDISNFKSEFDRALDDEKLAKEIILTKRKLESGEMEFKDNPEKYISDLTCSEEYLQQKMNMTIVHYKKQKLQWLKDEGKLIKHSSEIKRALGLEQADPKTALFHLLQIEKMTIDPLMLKKHPNFVEMLKRLLRYVGNVKLWNLTGAKLELFQSRALEIRNATARVYDKIKCLFAYGDEDDFFDQFMDAAKVLKRQTDLMKESEAFGLCAEPYSRRAILDQLYDSYQQSIITEIED